jgi:tripartite-type tricarboxylate transporter receptor subunit TctC
VVRCVRAQGHAGAGDHGLNKAVNEALPSLEQQMIREGADPVGGSAAQLGQFVQKEFEKWRTVVKESGATAE